MSIVFTGRRNSTPECEFRSAVWLMRIILSRASRIYCLEGVETELDIETRDMAREEKAAYDMLCSDVTLFLHFYETNEEVTITQYLEGFLKLTRDQKFVAYVLDYINAKTEASSASLELRSPWQLLKGYEASLYHDK